MTASNIAAIETAAPAKKSSISPADPCTIVIFGASGDLSRRKLVPALYGLAAQNCLARRCCSQHEPAYLMADGKGPSFGLNGCSRWL